MLGGDSMGALIKGLSHVYEEYGQYHTWIVDGEAERAITNPLTGSLDIGALRRAHRIDLFRYGLITLRDLPITANEVCDHAK